MILAVIFDMDGLLTDTECLHCQAYQQTLAEVGVAVSEAEYADHWIRSGLGIADYVNLKLLPHDPAALRRRKAVVYEGLVKSHVRPMPGAVELLETLRGRKRLALATSAYSADARLVLRTLQLEAHFEVIATQEDVRHVKPAPDLFLFAAERMGLPPRQCVVLEDAEKGVRAAVSAGMPVIAVPSIHTASNDFSMATRVVSSLREVTMEMLDGLTTP